MFPLFAYFHTQQEDISNVQVDDTSNCLQYFNLVSTHPLDRRLKKTEH